jgi:hypothetical protein
MAVSDYDKYQSFLSTIPVLTKDPVWEKTCPKEGSFIGYKKCNAVGMFLKADSPLYRNILKICIVTLEIPEDAKRLQNFLSGKCRCDKAKVLKIETLDGKEVNGAISRFFDKKVIYRPGEMVYADYFEPCTWIECAGGIHFFMTKEEAIRY